MKALRSSAILTLFAAILATAIASCGGKKASDNIDTGKHKLPDTLRVATLYSPTSYFIYRDEPMGYDYSLLSQFASDKGMEIELKVAPSMQKMIEMLDSGEVDLLAYEIPITAEYRDILACGPEIITHQVLVQPKRDSLITDETQLVGKDVYVESNSKYLYRLQNLNDELGGGINIHVIDRDTLITEDLIDMVSSGEIPLTIVDSDIAKVNKTYHKGLDISLPLSFAQKSSWGVRPSDSWLADSINAWFKQEDPTGRQASLLKRYFELSKENTTEFSLEIKNGKVSPYDHFFQKYATEVGMDWRLLASQGYHESRFDPSRVSWAGARGVMQIMPRTARAYNLPASKIADPESNIKTATKILKDLDKMLAKRVPDSNERIKFVLAAYNGGIGHVIDAIELAKKYGKNPQVWKGNVEVTLQMKSNPEYYTDPVCKAGYFRGRETVAYVREVISCYDRLKKKTTA